MGVGGDGVDPGLNRPRPLCEVGEARRGELASESGARRTPALVKRTDRLPTARPVPERARPGSERAFAGLDDLEEADLGRRAGEAVAAVLAERRDRKIGVDEVAEDLGNEGTRYAHLRGDLTELLRQTRVVRRARQIAERTT